MERRIDHTIHDILDTIERVQTKIHGKIFAEFETDWELRFIVQRAIEIISEAALCRVYRAWQSSRADDVGEVRVVVDERGWKA